MAQNTTHTTYVYASNSSTSFNDTTFASRTSDSNLVLISNGTYTNSGYYTENMFSSDTTNLYRYIHVFVYNGTNFESEVRLAKVVSLKLVELVEAYIYVV